MNVDWVSTMFDGVAGGAIGAIVAFAAAVKVSRSDKRGAADERRVAAAMKATSLLYEGTLPLLRTRDEDDGIVSLRELRKLESDSAVLAYRGGVASLPLGEQHAESVLEIINRDSPDRETSELVDAFKVRYEKYLSQVKDDLVVVAKGLREEIRRF